MNRFRSKSDLDQTFNKYFADIQEPDLKQKVLLYIDHEDLTDIR